MSRWALPAVKIAIPLILSFFIGRMIHGSWQQIRAEPWQLDPVRLALSFACAAAWYLVRPFGWTQLINAFGHDLRYGDVYRAYRKSELSRYVPGGVWQFASRVYLTRRYGVEAATCLCATMLDMVLAALASLVPAAWLAASAATSLEGWQKGLLLAFPVLACGAVYPRALNAWAGPLARRAKLPFRPIEITAARMLSIWAGYVGAWILLAFAMALFASAILPSLDGGQLTAIAGRYALAWFVALLTMVAPAGVGVREGLLGLLLAQVVAAGTAMTLAVAMRLWLVAMEVVWLAAGAAMPRDGTR